MCTNFNYKKSSKRAVKSEILPIPCHILYFPFPISHFASHIFLTNLAGKKRVNYVYEFFLSRKDCLNHIFNTNAFFFILLTGATLYYHDISIVFTSFASFTGYEDDSFQVVSKLYIWRKIWKELDRAWLVGLAFIGLL